MCQNVQQISNFVCVEHKLKVWQFAIDNLVFKFMLSNVSKGIQASGSSSFKFLDFSCEFAELVLYCGASIMGEKPIFFTDDYPVSKLSMTVYLRI